MPPSRSSTAPTTRTCAPRLTCCARARCKDLLLLETYSTLPLAELQSRLPPFLSLAGNVTGQAEFSMYNLSLRDDWDKQNFYSGPAGKTDGPAAPPASSPRPGGH